jgi:serine/threonine protein kinase
VIQAMGDRLVLGTLGVGAVTLTVAVRRDGEPVRAGKRLHPRFRSDEEARALLLREGEILRRLDGRGAPRFVEAGEDLLGPYLVMEHLAMPSLSAQDSSVRLRGTPWFSGASRSILRALAEVHEATDSDGPLAIVHADLCPDNVLVGDDGRAAAIVDFGLSRWRDDQGPASGAFRGSLGYVAPEVARGEAPDSRSDLFALAVSLLAAASGELPRQGSDFASLLATAAEVGIHDYAVRASVALPADVSRLLVECVHFDPRDRPASAQEALARLG